MMGSNHIPSPLKAAMDRTPPDEYDEWLAGLSFKALTEMFTKRGCTRVLVKTLAPRQDNDKNQIYLGQDLTQLGDIPMGEVEASLTTSGKEGAAGKTKFTAPVDLAWISPTGDSTAPRTKLIFYPQYARGRGEVRLSGAVAGSPNPPLNLYVRDMGAQRAGRRLLLGLGPTERVWAMILPPDSIAGSEIESAVSDSDTVGVLSVWRLAAPGAPSSRQVLLDRLAEISVAGWHEGRILGSGGVRPYRARNGGGYTLEALLGVAANGRAEPDFEGWEVKARKVADPDRPNSNGVITLMTPEPVYRIGFNDFMRRYGRNRNDDVARYDFTGRHFANGDMVPRTRMKLIVAGWHGGNEIEPTARISLVDEAGDEAAVWDIVQMVTHWTRKHAKCVYVPYTDRPADSTTEYRYGALVRMCEDTTLAKLMEGFVDHVVYYDPGMNLKILEGGREVGHRRSQFRVRYRDINALYGAVVDVDANTHRIE